MSARRESLTIAEKNDVEIATEPASLGEHLRGRQFSVEPQNVEIVEADQGKLHRDLKGILCSVLSSMV